MDNNLSKVREFMRASGQLTSFANLEDHEQTDLVRLRLSLIAEEFGELCEAVLSPDSAIRVNISRNIEYIQKSLIEADGLDIDFDIEETLDALVDIEYVTLGAGIALELPMQSGFDEVHTSNMSKFCYNQTDVNLSVKKYADQDITVTHRTDDGELFVIINPESNKVLKGINYKEPNFTQWSTHDYR